jgi:dynein heavy chain, axonemal
VENINFNLRYECTTAYELMNAENCLLFEMERELEQIRDTASLFEVPVPELRPIINCRRDMKLTKVRQFYKSSVLIK